MINMGRVLRFWGKVFRYFIPIALIVFVLAGLTTILARIITSSTVTLAPGFFLDFGLDLLLNVLAFGAVIIAISLVAGRFVLRIYDLDNTKQGIGFLIRHLFGKLGFGPYLLASHGQIGRGDGAVKEIGGPGALVVHNDTAVVLEQKGKLTRIVGPGLPTLEPFEKVYNVIDLQPKRWVYSVEAMSKEGIPVTWDVEICYQIDDGGRPPTESRPYPFSEAAVLRAATSTWRREKDRIQDMDWEGRIVVSTAEGTLRSILARRHLDELIGLTEADSLAVREAIQQELTVALQRAAPDFGAKILGVKLHNLKVQDGVTEQWIKAWQSQWQSWSTHKLAPKEAGRIQQYETAKAQAHILALSALSKELQKLGQADQAVILIRLASALDQGTMGAASRVFFPGQAVETLENIRRMLNEGGSSEEGNRAAREDSEDDSASDRNGKTSDRTSLPASRAKPKPSSQKYSVVIPLFDAIAAGKEKPVFDDIQGYIQQVNELEFELEGQCLQAFPLRGKRNLTFSKECKYIAVQVSGDSMDRAGIAPQDYVILQKQAVGAFHPASGDIVAVVSHDEDDKATLKRIFFEPDRVILKPDSSNPEHRSRILSLKAYASEHPQVEIVGLAVAILTHQGRVET